MEDGLELTTKYTILHGADALDVFDSVRDRYTDDPCTDVILLQTVSGDLMMNAGIARQINNRYGFKDYIFRSLIRMGVRCNVQNHQLSAVLHSVYVRGRMDEHAGRSDAARCEFGRKFQVNKTTGMIDILEPTNAVTFFVKRRRK